MRQRYGAVGGEYLAQIPVDGEPAHLGPMSKGVVGPPRRIDCVTVGRIESRRQQRMRTHPPPVEIVRAAAVRPTISIARRRAGPPTGQRSPSVVEALQCSLVGSPISKVARGCREPPRLIGRGNGFRSLISLDLWP